MLAHLSRACCDYSEVSLIFVAPKKCADRLCTRVRPHQSSRLLWQVNIQQRLSLVVSQSSAQCQVQTFRPERLPVGKILPIRSAKTRYQISASRYGSVGTMIPTSTASQPPFKNPHGDFCYLFHQRYLIKRQVRGNVAPDECQLFPRRMTRFFITTHRKR